MTRRDWTGTVFEMGVTRPLLFCALAYTIGTVLGTARAVWLIARADETDCGEADYLPSDWFGTWSA